MYSCLILVLYLPDTVLNTLLQNATVAAFIQEEVRLVFYLLETRERPLCSHIKVYTVYISLMMHTIPQFLAILSHLFKMKLADICCKTIKELNFPM